MHVSERDRDKIYQRDRCDLNMLINHGPIELYYIHIFIPISTTFSRLPLHGVFNTLKSLPLCALAFADSENSRSLTSMTYQRCGRHDRPSASVLQFYR